MHVQGKSHFEVHRKCLSVAQDMARKFDSVCPMGRERAPRLQFIDCHGFRCQDAGVER